MNARDKVVIMCSVHARFVNGCIRSCFFLVSLHLQAPQGHGGPRAPLEGSASRRVRNRDAVAGPPVPCENSRDPGEHA